MTNLFSPGQRWVSHADSSLGLGIVTQVDERRVTLHFPAVEEERVYATDRAPLTRLLLKPGDQLTRLDGSTFTVLSVEHIAELAIYETVGEDDSRQVVKEAELDAHIELNTPIERLLNNQLSKTADFDLRRITLEHSAAGEGFGLQGLLGPRTSLLSHQLYVAASIGKQSAPRVLLADEVGLGKTIEAGLILSQQLLRQRVSRVLVLTPESLTHQWLVEMQRRFHLAFSLLNEHRLEDANWEEEYTDSPLVISPITLFSDNAQLQQIVIGLPWDMVIIDEAHHISGLRDPQSDLGAFVGQLAGRARGLLLLTATPEQAGPEAHFERLRLIDPSRFPSFDQFKREQAHFSRWNQVIEQIEAGLSPTLPEGIDPNSGPEEQIQQMLDRYGTGRVLYRNSRRAVSGFPQRLLNAYPLTAPDLYADAPDALHPELTHLNDEWLEQDPRVAWLQEALKTLRPEKALVICAHKETALALEHHLHFKVGVRCAAFHEGLSLIERDRAAAYFADELSGAQALICSEIGSEGRNFQFARHLVCFDLPRHPDLLEQRIGRLDRIGQGSEIHIHVPYLLGTAQEQLFLWLHNGLGAFSATCSFGHQIFNEFESTLNAVMRGEEGPQSLINATRDRREQLTLETEQGRNRLLERHSHNSDTGRHIIQSLEARESASNLYDFTERLFDRIGIDQEYLEENLSLVRPTENLVTGQLPGLNEEGVTATYDRSTALAREDVLFLTWEHPIIMESMAVLLGSEIGKACLGTFAHKGVPAGTFLLEALFRIECLAPRYLEAGQFLDYTPIRMLVTKDGKEVGDKLSANYLAEALQSVPSATSAAVLSKLRAMLDALFGSLEQRAIDATHQRRQAAVEKAHHFYRGESSRLTYLKTINPGVTERELDALAEEQSACLRALEQTKPVLEGLRVCIAV